MKNRERAGNKSIAELGRKAAEANKAETLNRIERGKRKIIQDIERYEGVYPVGKITVAEVLRRAGLTKDVLQKPRHHESRSELTSWVNDLKSRLLSGKALRGAVTARADAARSDLDEIMQKWAEAELEFVETSKALADARKRLENWRQRTQNCALRLAPPLSVRSVIVLSGSGTSISGGQGENVNVLL